MSTPLPPIVQIGQVPRNQRANSINNVPNLTPKQRRQQQLLNEAEQQSSQQRQQQPNFIDPKNVRYYQPFQSYILHPTGAVRDEAKRTHPKGFRYRVMSSPLERNMNSYFRLPVNPPKRTAQEFAKAHTAAQKAEHIRLKELKKAKVLNGFAVLKAANVQDPSAVVELSISGKNFGSVVSEDLSFFTSLRMLDVGDNEGLTLAQFATIPNLEELHLHCNMLFSIAAAPSSEEFMSLHTLNVAFNHLTKKDFIMIGKCCPSLQRLDFSHNNLGSLNRDEADFAKIFPQLHQLAIENNNLSDGTGIFTALSELPQLQELNCNQNKFESITLLPPKPDAAAASATQKTHSKQRQAEEEEDLEEEGMMSTTDAKENYVASPQLFVPFPALSTIGLANNQISSIEAVAALSRFPSLRRVILWGNPLQRQRRFESDLVSVEFESIGVEALMQEPDKMARAKVGKFYNKNDCPFFAVEATDGSGLPRSKKRRFMQSQNQHIGIGHTMLDTNLQQHNTDIYQQQQQQQQDTLSGTTKQQQQTADPYNHLEETQNNNNNNNNNEATTTSATGPSFFMTEGDDFGSQTLNNTRHSRAASQPPNNNNNNNNSYSTYRTNQHLTNLQQSREDPYSTAEVAANVAASGMFPSAYGQPMRNLNDNNNNNNSGIRSNLQDPDVEGTRFEMNDQSSSYNMMRQSAGATLRSVVTDLRRALRQPLPPLPL